MAYTRVFLNIPVERFNTVIREKPASHCLLAALAFSALLGCAHADIVGRYVAKDAEFTVQKDKDGQYRVSYFGRCSLNDQPFEFYTNGTVKKLSESSFAINLTTNRNPSCAAFSAFASQSHTISLESADTMQWRFQKTEPSWLTKHPFVRVNPP